MAFNYSMAIQSTNVVATGIAIYFMGRVGRRKFYLFGVSGIGLCQLMIGIIGVASIGRAKEGIAVAVMMIMINLVFKLSLGPACYTIIGETPNSRVRAQSVVLARTTYIIGNTVNGQLIPRMLSATAWNWQAKCGWYFFGMCALGLVYAYFRIAETKVSTFRPPSRSNGANVIGSIIP